MNKPKSPLRYPGGKSRALEQIKHQLPPSFTDYREPLVGGGSVFLLIRSLYPNVSCWINDLNPDVYAFWHTLQNDCSTLIKSFLAMKQYHKDGRTLFKELKAQDPDQLTTPERATRFFVLNRISFSGTTDAGGYSQQAFEQRFNTTLVERLSYCETLLQNVRITNFDYLECLGGNHDTLIYLDPPYHSNRSAKLYGRNGDLHKTFDENRFASNLQSQQCQWLVTYDNCDVIRNLFSFATITPWELQYGMNNYKKRGQKRERAIY